MKRESMVFYGGWLDAIDNLELNVRGEILTAIVTYGIKGEILKDMSPVAKAMFSMAKPQIDANNKKYVNGCKGAEGGRKGGRPASKKDVEKPQENPIGVTDKNPKETPKKPQGVISENPKETPNDNDNDNVNDNVIYSGDNIDTTKSIDSKDNKDKENLSKERSKKPVSLPSPSERLDYDGLKEFFNYTFKGKLGSVREMTPSRKQAVKARITQYGKESIRVCFHKILESPFLLGANDRNWTADFDWIFKQANYTKILEGKYDQKSSTNSKADRKAGVSRLKDLAGAILAESATEENQ